MALSVARMHSLIHSPLDYEQAFPTAWNVLSSTLPLARFNIYVINPLFLIIAYFTFTPVIMICSYMFICVVIIFLLHGSQIQVTHSVQGYNCLWSMPDHSLVLFLPFITFLSLSPSFLSP